MTPFKTTAFPLIVLTLAASLALSACDEGHFGGEVDDAGDEVEDATDEAG